MIFSAFQSPRELVNFSFGRDEGLAAVDYRPTGHERFTIYALRTGSATVRLSSIDLPLQAGETMVIGPGVEYGYHPKRGVPHEIDWCESDVVERTEEPFWQVAPTAPSIERLMDLGLNTDFVQPERAAFQAHLGAALMMEVNKVIKQAQGGISKRATTARLQQILRGDLEQHWTIPSMAKAMRMSSRTLCRRLEFEERSPSEILWAERVHKAVGLLGQPAMTSNEIAESCGFKSAYHFSRRIKQVTGRSPTELRSWLASCSLTERQTLLQRSQQ